jgi:signal transduction histidine kinase
MTRYAQRAGGDGIGKAKRTTVLAEGRFSLRLFAAFSAIALAFVGSSVYTSWRSLEIENATYDLTANALPGVEHLTRAVDAVRDLEGASDAYADMTPEQRPGGRKRIREHWRTLDAELDTYLALPSFPDERRLWGDVPTSIRGLDAAVEELFAAADAGPGIPFVAESEVRDRANQATALLRSLVTFNAGQALAASNRIRSTRHRVAITAAMLDVTTLLFTFAVAVWTWRIFRSHSHLQLEHAALVERRADELEVFGRRVAHDLISPLSSLTFCLTAFKPASEHDPKLANALGRARQCVIRAQGLVNNVFDFARSGGTPSPDATASVTEVVDQVVEDALAVDPAERPEIELSPLPHCAVRCSKGVLTSILGNLVGNAVKFMRDSSERRITLRVVESGNEVRFDIEDTGPGVPAGLEDAIFLPYVRGEGVTQPGLGLGLATVRRFCEAHGGTVGVRSTSGRGSSFFFTLPRAAPQERGAQAQVSAKRARELAS